MSALADAQDALLSAILAAPQTRPESPADMTSATAAAHARTDGLTHHVHAPWQRGLAAYRANGHASAERSLLAAYPVVAALMGEESFALMARDFWHQHPPTRGDLAQWGEALAPFVARNAQLADVPYLADVARVEWALHRAAGAPDSAADPASFALLSSTEPDALTLRLSPGSAVLVSDWPVASLLTAHLYGEPAMDQVAAKMQARAAENALVWRQGMRPCVRECTLAETALIQALAARQPLLTALDAALAQDPDFDLGAWLPSAVQQGLLLGAEPLDPKATEQKETPK